MREIHWRTYGVTEIDPLALGIALAMGLALLFVQRRHAVIPLLVVFCLLPVAQRIVVFTLDFSLVRIMLLFGLARIFGRGEWRGFRPNAMDWTILAWLVVGTLAYTAREGTSEALIYRLGFSFESGSAYLLFRTLLRTPEDVARVARQTVPVLVVLAIAMVIEYSMERNPFSVFAGVSEIALVREGRLRAQGPFPHPVMIGSFGAVCASLLIGTVIARPRTRTLGIVGLFAALAVTITSNSSGPALSLVAGILGWALWPLRRNMRAVQIFVVSVLTVIHFAREKPVWHLIGRAGDLVGGTGYHRYRLIDAFFGHFSEWALVGTNGAAQWGWGLQDITNQFVLEGVRGGFATLLCFIAILVLSFRNVGRSVVRRVRSREDHQDRLVAWSVGVSLAVHCVSFISVSYFGQMQVLFLLNLAFTHALGLPMTRRRARAKAPQAARASRVPGGRSVVEPNAGGAGVGG